MDCPVCSAPNEDSARFCSTCGQPLVGLSEERRVVTVLFADLVGFTALSEHLDPEDVKRVVDRAFERLVRDVDAFGGRVDKLVGDAVVALFGAPVAHEDDAERAVRAAMAMQDSLAEYGSEVGMDIRMRVGVNTGEVLVGALRAGGDYTAMGDVVNLASRLQSAASPGEVVVGDVTHRATEEAIGYESRGQLTARGREQSEKVWVAVSALRPPGRSPRAAGTPLIGRQTELDVVLNAARGSIRNGRAQVVLLVGEAGVGKSRLAHEMASVLAVDDEVAGYEGRCPPYGEVNPWWPIAEVLRAAIGLDVATGQPDAEPATRAVVGRVIEAERVGAITDGLLHVMGYDGPLRAMEGSVARIEAVQALLDFLDGRLREGPVMVRIADLHWADDAVFELIDEISSRLARRPLILVGTARPDLQSRWTPGTGGFNSLLLNLDPLDRPSLARLLDHLTVEPLSGEAREMLMDRSGGNPFYLEELVALLESPHGHGTALVGDLPETLRGLVAARIDSLTPEEQAVLGDAAIWGPSGSTVVLDRIASVARGVASVAPQIDTLVGKDVLDLDSGRWSFRSDLVREVTYARLTRRDRLHGHAEIADYLDRRLAVDDADDTMVEIVGRHFTEAALLAIAVGEETMAVRLVRRGIVWLRETARRAESAGAWPAVVRLQSRIIDLDGDDPAVRVVALLGRSRALAEQWEHDTALRDAEEALGLAEAHGWDTRLAEGFRAVAAAEMRHGEWHRVDDVLARALALYEAVDDSAGRAETLRQSGLSQLMRGDHRAAEEPILGALDAFRTQGDRRGEGWALQNLAWISVNDERIDEAAAYVTASEEAFEEVSDRGGLQWTLGLSAFILLARGDFDEARSTAQGVLGGSERRGDRFATAMMHVVLGAVALWTGHPAGAVAAADEAIRNLGTTADLVGVELALTLRGRALVMAGDVSAGLASLSQSLGVSGGTSVSFAETVAALTEIQLGLPGSLLTDGLPEGLLGTATAALWELQCACATSAQQTGMELTPIVDLDLDQPAQLVASATVHAAVGDPAEARRLIEALGSRAGVTYLDRATAAVVEALLSGESREHAALMEVRRECSDLGDTVMEALVGLADAVLSERAGSGSTRMDAALKGLTALGLTDTRWVDVYRAIAERTADDGIVERRSR